MEIKKTDDEEIEIDIRALFLLLWKKIIIIIMVGIVCAIAAYLLTLFFIPPKYESETKLYVINRANDDSTTLSDLQVSTQLTKDYQILVKSTPVMEQVIKKLGLDMTSEELAKTITVTTVTDTRILQIDVTNQDPYMAKKIVDTVATVSADRICEIMDIDKVNVIEEGQVATKPVSSNRVRNVAIGGIIGVVLTCLIIVLRSIMDDTIKTSDDVERYLGISTLAIIPICEELDDGTRSNSKKKRKKK